MRAGVQKELQDLETSAGIVTFAHPWLIPDEKYRETLVVSRY